MLGKQDPPPFSSFPQRRSRKTILWSPVQLWRKCHGKSLGFTLIELMMVVAIISLLAAVATPKFANMVIKAREAAVKGKLGSVRSAISIYYADTEGILPSLSVAGALTSGSKYLDTIPKIAIPTVPSHVNNNWITADNINLDWTSNVPLPAGVSGAAWKYNSALGKLSVNCTHTDSNGGIWSTY